MERFEPNLRIPGPTGLPPSVREAGGRQMINHRGPEFAAMLERILTGMKPYFGTTSDIAIITTAGTGGLEAAVVNTLSPGDRVLGVSIGSFGDRFAKIARTYGADVTKIDVEWGQAAHPAVLRDALQVYQGDCSTDEAPCLDGNLCTAGDTCQGRRCQPGTPLPDGTACQLVCASPVETCQAGECTPPPGGCP